MKTTTYITDKKADAVLNGIYGGDYKAFFGDADLFDAVEKYEHFSPAHFLRAMAKEIGAYRFSIAAHLDECLKNNR